MTIFHFLGFSGRGLSLKLLVLNTQLLKIWNGAERFCLVAVLYMEDGILVNSATFTDGETWFGPLEVVVVEDFPSCGHDNQLSYDSNEEPIDHNGEMSLNATQEQEPATT